MDVYMQAAAAVQAVREKKHDLKRVVIADKKVQKKRQTFALAAESLKHAGLLDDLLQQSGFFAQNKTFWPALALVLTHDLILGGGIRCKTTTGAPYAVQKHRTKLKQALEVVMKKRKVKTVEELVKKEGVPPRIPIYLRVNTMKTRVDAVQSSFEKAGWKFLADAEGPDAVLNLKRKREGEGEKAKEVKAPKAKKRRKQKQDEDEEDDEGEEDQKGGKGRVEADRVFYRDSLIPSLLVFPPSTKFKLVKTAVIHRGEALIQDKASCLPAMVATHSVPMLSLLDQTPQNPGKPSPTVATTKLGGVLDATAAPGNKTSHVCSLVHTKARVVAVERDAPRAETLRTRLEHFGAGKVEVVEGSFLDLNPDDYRNIECILLDPSCSGSGIQGRVGEKDSDELQARLEKLSDFQGQMLAHAMSFPAVRRIVYSTCSIHKEENEFVVRTAIEAAEGKWGLADVMPGVWKTRGLPVMQDGENCIRCGPATDATQGFFLACLERKPRTGKKKKKKKKKDKKAKSEQEDKDGAGEEELEVEIKEGGLEDSDDEDEGD